MLILLRACPLQSQFNKKLQAKIPVPQWVPQLKFMITCDFCLQELEFLIVQIVDAKYLLNQLKQFAILFSRTLRVRKSLSCRQSFREKKEHMKNCLNKSSEMDILE